MQGSSSRALRSPPESHLANRLPARVCRRGRLPWGFVPHHDVSTRSPLTDGRPEPVYVPPAAFRTLSTVCSSPRLARLFHRAAVSRVLAPGVGSTPVRVTSSV